MHHETDESARALRAVDPRARAAAARCVRPRPLRTDGSSWRCRCSAPARSGSSGVPSRTSSARGARIGRAERIPDASAEASCSASTGSRRCPEKAQRLRRQLPEPDEPRGAGEIVRADELEPRRSAVLGEPCETAQQRELIVAIVLEPQHDALVVAAGRGQAALLVARAVEHGGEVEPKVWAEVVGDESRALLEPVGRVGDRALKVRIDVGVEVAVAARRREAHARCRARSGCASCGNRRREHSAPSARRARSMAPTCCFSAAQLAKRSSRAMQCCACASFGALEVVKPAPCRRRRAASVAGLGGLQQIFGALLLLLEIQAERGIGLRIVDRS